jgi:hypothetical protein
MSRGKHYLEVTLGETPLHKWRNKVVPYDGPPLKDGDVVRFEIDTSTMTVVWNPPNPPPGYKAMDPEEE